MANELLYYAVTLSRKLKYLELYILSDLHYGNEFCDMQRWLEMLEYIGETPEAYVILNGDLSESSLRSTKGDIFRQVGTPQDQRDWNIKQLQPIKHKVLGMTTGNHEDRIYNECGVDLSKDIAANLGCPYDPDGVYLKISFGDNNNYTEGKPFVYWIYSTHGYGGARTKAAKAVKVERLATWLHADVYGMSHDHVVNVAPDVYLMPDPRTYAEKDKDGELTGFMRGKVTAHRKELVKTNAYLKWGGYSRKLGFPPVDLITPTIWLAGTHKPWPHAEKNRRPEVRVIV